jgi:hypothetical protein
MPEESLPMLLTSLRTNLEQLAISQSSPLPHFIRIQLQVQIGEESLARELTNLRRDLEQLVVNLPAPLPNSILPTVGKLTE